MFNISANMTCHALSIWDEAHVRDIAESAAQEKINDAISTDVVEFGKMTPGAYRYFCDIENRLFAMQSQINNNVGASSDQINNVNNNVQNVDKKVDDVKNAVDKIDVKGDMEKFYADKETTNPKDAKGHVSNLCDSMIKATNNLWKSIGAVLIAASTGILSYKGFTINIQNFADSGTTEGKVFSIMKLFAYSLVLLFFSINLVETTVKYEMISMKSVIAMIARIAVSKFLIDNGGLICIKIIGIVNNQVFSLSLSSVTNNGVIPNMGLILAKESNLWVIGWIVDFFLSMLYAIPVLLTCFLVSITAAIVMVKLILWSIDLAILTAVSPVYVACWSSDVTKQYCRNFFLTFIQASAQLFYIGIVYSVFTSWLSGVSSSNGSPLAAVDYFTNCLPNLVIMIAMTIMMVKPPRMLNGILH